MNSCVPYHHRLYYLAAYAYLSTQTLSLPANTRALVNAADDNCKCLGVCGLPAKACKVLMLPHMVCGHPAGCMHKLVQ